MSNDNDWLSQVKARLKAATPGPWFVAEQPFDNRSTAVYGDNKAQVPCDPHGARFITDCDVTMEWTEGEPDQSVFDRANAALIAASPTDLDKAIRIIECYEEALDHYSKLQDWKMLPVPAIDSLAEAAKIKEEK